MKEHKFNNYKILISDLIWFFELIKLNLRSEFAYKTSFFMQILGMAINNSAFIIVWYIFLKVFKNQISWDFSNLLLLMGSATIIYGIVTFLFQPIKDLPKRIYFNELDLYLNKPKPLLLSISASSVSISAIGDLVFGIICTSISFFLLKLSMISIIYLIAMIALGCIIFYSFHVVSSSIIFFISNSFEITQILNEFFIGMTIYPVFDIKGAVRTIFTFIIPSFFCSIIIVEQLNNFKLTTLIITTATAIFWLILAIKIFYWGVKKYESGNSVRNV